MHSIAEGLAKKQRKISVAEFFERNKQILGFDTSTRALITSVKEAVDNALDACEEAGILPDILVELKSIDDDEYLIIVEDNGPGIVRKQIPHVFARLLYGSRFHSLKQSRGQQGIGISAAVLYSQLTTGKPTVVTSKIGDGLPAHRCTLLIDTKKNRPEILHDEMTHWEKSSGTRIELAMRGSYVRNRKQSVYGYLRSTAIVNPHAHITFIEPNGNKIVFERVTDKLPPQPREIKPHPYGIELGTFIKMAKESKARKLTSFLSSEFSSVSLQKAKEIIKIAGLDASLNPNKLSLEDAKKIASAFKKVKWIAPPTDSLVPIGKQQIELSFQNLFSPEALFISERSPKVFRGGIPFMIETAIAYGGGISAAGKRGEIMRFSNRVPLLFDSGGCAITETVKSIDWRRYNLKKFDEEPIVVLINLVSVHVPYTSAGKQAISKEEEIISEMKAAVMESARGIQRYLSGKRKAHEIATKKKVLSRYVHELVHDLSLLTGKSPDRLEKKLIELIEGRYLKKPAKRQENNSTGENKKHIQKKLSEEGKG